MSTKTTFKRIALVAVSALGFGVLTSVAPANAAPTRLTPTSVTLGTPSPARAGETVSVSVSLGYAANLATNDTVTVHAKILSAPSTSRHKVATASHVGNTKAGTSPVETGNLVFNGTSASAGTSRSVVNTDQTALANVGTVLGISSTAVSAVATYTQPATQVATWTGLSLNFVPDVEGTYTILVSAAGNDDSTGYLAGNPSATLTITTAGVPNKLSVTRLGGFIVTGGSAGALIEVSLEDANGNPTILTPTEAITVATADTTVTISNTAIGAGDVDDGAYYVNITPTGTIASGTSVISFTGSGTLPATLTTNISVTKVVATTETADTVKCTTTANCDGAAGGATAGAAFTANVGGATSVTIGGLTSATTAKNHLAVVTAGGITYDSYYTVAATAAAGTAGAATATFSVPAPSTGLASVVVFGATTATLTYAAPAAKSIAVQGQSTVLSATGAVNKFVALVADQYGKGIANVAVNITVSGRNTVATRALGVSDADGLVSYTLTDAGTTGTRDTITFSGTVSSQTLNANVATINYGTVTVSTVTVTGGSTVADTGLTKGTTKTAINAADNGPETSRVAITAVVKDAAGNVLSGVPVTFAVDSGAIYKTAAVDYSTVYTNSSGEAVSYIFDWKTGTQTVTVTAGGVSKTDYLTWEANTATSARVLSGSVDGNIISYKVVDRFGNPVNGVAITLSRTGSGLFGNGASTQSITTDKTGTADASFTGNATVVAELAATTQAYAAADKIGTTALTAAVAGTTKGTGDTLAPAGVGKLELAVTLGTDAATSAANAASDAAAEAIDAANAATDAANLAAEAADAATVAAEEARDAADAATAAVEELATQVATLMAALKAQITTLANTVAKIAKKVKA